MHGAACQQALRLAYACGVWLLGGGTGQERERERAQQDLLQRQLHLQRNQRLSTSGGGGGGGGGGGEAQGEVGHLGLQTCKRLYLPQHVPSGGTREALVEQQAAAALTPAEATSLGFTGVVLGHACGCLLLACSCASASCWCAG